MQLLAQIKQLAKLAAQATAGPWTFAPAGDYDAWSLIIVADEFKHRGNTSGAYDFGSLSDVEDAAFIATARNIFMPENLILLEALATSATGWVAVADALPAGACQLLLARSSGKVGSAYFLPVDEWARENMVVQNGAYMEIADFMYWMPMPLAPESLTHFSHT